MFIYRPNPLAVKDVYSQLEMSCTLSSVLSTGSDVVAEKYPTAGYNTPERSLCFVFLDYYSCLQVAGRVDKLVVRMCP